MHKIDYNIKYNNVSKDHVKPLPEKVCAICDAEVDLEYKKAILFKGFYVCDECLQYLAKYNNDEDDPIA